MSCRRTASSLTNDVWRCGFNPERGRSSAEDSMVVERYRLERGGVLLGIVTRGEWDGHQASWHDWGWLEPVPDATAALDLLTAECRLYDEAVRLELAGGDAASL